MPTFSTNHTQTHTDTQAHTHTHTHILQTRNERKHARLVLLKLSMFDINIFSYIHFSIKDVTLFFSTNTIS